MSNTYTLYCDAAGGNDHGFIVVAGYLSTFEKWDSFESQWALHLATYNLPYFHMTEFAHFKGPFAEWNGDEERRKTFLSGAAMIIARHVERSFASLVEFEHFNRVNQQYCLDDVAGVPYSLAARNCVSQTAEYLQTRDATYVFEDGDEGKGQLMRIMERDGYPPPVFLPSCDTYKNGHLVKGAIPLQAADFAAYEVRRGFRDDPRESWPFEKYRRSLQALMPIAFSSDRDWGRFREEELVALCKQMQARPRN